MKKAFLVFGLIFFFIFNTIHIYAYWKDTNENLYITDEKPVEIIEQSMSSTDGKYLVPKGVILGENEVDEIIFTYKIFVQQDKELVIGIQNLSINDIPLTDDLKELFEFTFEKQVISKENLQLQLYERSEEGYFYQVTLHISMKMPTYEQYKIIAGKVLYFEVGFKANEQ